MHRSLPMVVLSLAACGAPEPSVFVGKAQGAELAVGWVEAEGAVRAYACGGPTTFGDDTRWFDAKADASGAFSADVDGWTFAGAPASADAPDAGLVEVTAPGGDTTTISVHPPADALEGLWEADDAGCVTGAVVWRDTAGEPRLQGTWCDAEGNAAQVTPVLPLAVVDHGIRVSVDLAALGLGTRELVVRRVRP